MRFQARARGTSASPVRCRFAEPRAGASSLKLFATPTSAPFFRRVWFGSVHGKVGRAPRHF
eukprot:6512875-Lingulodinium_polyedra.AAC.1